MRRIRGEFGQDVAGVVEVDVGEAELLEAVEEPGGAGGFAEGWGGDADDLELPLAELGLVEVQPVEGAVDGGEGGEACDAALGGGGRRVIVLDLDEEEAACGGGGAGGAAVAGGEDGWDCVGGDAVAAASTKVPTRLRTMWWRKPLPVTR